MAQATTAGVTKTLDIRKRSTGTRASKQLRREGLIPGVVYGRSVEPVPIAIAHKELIRVLHAKAGEHALVTLRLAGGGSDAKGTRARAEGAWEHPALVHAVQHDPVDGHVVHVDFHAIALTERIRVKVPVVLSGDPIGVKQDGGILEHFLREIEVECLPTEIPPTLEIDVTLLRIGHTVHVRDLAPTATTKITSDPDGVVASIQAPKAEQPAEAAAEAVAEPEVIREKKVEGEETAEGAEAKVESADAKKDKKEAKPEK